MARGIIWSVIVVSVFALVGCQKKAKEETQPIEVQAVSLEETAQATTAQGQMVPAQVSQTALDATNTLGAAAQQATTAVQESLASSSIEVEKTSNSIQEALKNAGFYSGAIDGNLGPKTKKAIEDFQAQNNLTVDGKVGPRTWAKLSQYLTVQGTQTTVPEPAAQVNY